MSELLVGAGYGRVIALRGDAEALEAARPELPSWWVESADTPERVFDLVAPGAVPLIVRNVESWIAEHARDAVFVHAAAVAIDGRAILLPGSSHSGKTTLCIELLRRGAVYLSEEFAVLDPAGEVMPYPRALYVRDDSGQRTAVSAESLGAATATEPTPIGLVALLHYREDGAWSVAPVAPAIAVLRLLDHTVCAQARPEASLDAVTRALAGARCVEGERRSAAEAADRLFKALRRR